MYEDHDHRLFWVVLWTTLFVACDAYNEWIK